jgi:hypothetical protein
VLAANLHDQPWKIARMNKITYALALGTGLVLSLTAPSAHADPIVQTLTPTTVSAVTFNTDFAAVTPVQSQPYSFFNTGGAGNVESQVFAGTGAFTGLYAYAYQFDVNNTNNTLINQPTSVNSASMLFNATPDAPSTASTMMVPGVVSATYVVTGGMVGAINPAVAAQGSVVQIPSSIAWQPGTTTGSLTFQYLNPTTNTPPLGAGTNSGTLIVLSSQAPGQQQYVSLQNPEPQTQYPLVYAPSNGPIEQVPAPEPATVLGWTAVLAALGVAQRFRRARQTA